jgi:hypothetical protein
LDAVAKRHPSEYRFAALSDRHQQQRRHYLTGQSHRSARIARETYPPIGLQQVDRQTGEISHTAGDGS